jgi:hypothetical protein
VKGGRLDPALIAHSDIAVVNPGELEQFDGWRPPVVVLTLGAEGVELQPSGQRIATLPGQAVDTTGAGDAFTGAIAAGLAEGLRLPEAARLGVAAAAIYVAGHGAMPSMPTRSQVTGRLSRSAARRSWWSILTGVAPRVVIWVCLAAALTLLYPTAADAAGNVLTNPGFETGDLTGWTAKGGTATVVTPAYDGSYSAQLSYTKGSTYSLAVTGAAVASTSDAHAYYATAFVRSDTPGRSICLRLREYSPSSAQVGSHHVCQAVSSGWAAMRALTYFASDSGDSLELDIYQKAPQAGDSFQLDDVSLSDDPVVITAGDIACDTSDPSYNGGLGTSTACQMANTAALIGAATPAALLPLGDEQYLCGTADQFSASYGASWGAYNPIAYPVPGNHEYGITSDGVCTQSQAQGYFAYFGARAGDPSTGYYSYDLGGWHLIALNSNCTVVSCAAGSAQETWLANDLAAHPATCTLAYFHHPLFSSSVAATTAVQPLWNDLYAARADLILNGHAHVYERFAPQTPTGAGSAKGITEIVVGTGGVAHASFKSTPAAHSQVRNNTTFGVLRLVLHSAGYSWTFLPDTASGTFTDSGSRSCH